MSDDRGNKPRGRPKTVARQRAIEVAMTTYWQDGPNATSLNEMCRRAGISKPALYREFGGEDGLMEAALAHYRQSFITPVLEILAADRPAAASLEQAIVVMTMERSSPAGCLFTKMRLTPEHLGPLTVARVRALEHERREAFETWYRRSLDRGEANPELAPDFAARYLDTQLTTVLVHRAAGDPPELVRAQARLALRALVPALGP